MKGWGLNVLRRQMNGDVAVGPGSHPQDRLSVGLVLGGGAARGFAHIGVLRTLMAHGIRPDIITGTSIGAVVAGLYAAGALDAFEAWCRGLTSGARLSRNLEEALGDTSFADVSMRLAAIATEIGTGHEIWLTRGRLREAMAASYALPGIFPPKLIGGRWLMDGAMVNPLPISAARALGARLVIAVNLNADNFGRGTIIQDHGPNADDEARRAQI